MLPAVNDMGRSGGKDVKKEEVSWPHSLPPRYLVFSFYPDTCIHVPGEITGSMSHL